MRLELRLKLSIVGELWVLAGKEFQKVWPDTLKVLLGGIKRRPVRTKISLEMSA